MSGRQLSQHQQFSSLSDRESLERKYEPPQASSWAPRHLVVLVASILLLIFVLWLLAGTVQSWALLSAPTKSTPLPDLVTPQSEIIGNKTTALPGDKPKKVTPLPDDTLKKRDSSGEVSMSSTTKLSHSIPKKVWMYRTGSAESEKKSQLRSYNRKFLTDSGFNITLINDTNYKTYLNRSTSLQLTSCLKLFRMFAQSQLEGASNAKMIIERVKTVSTQIRTLYVLEANGGVMMEESLTLTQDLSWIDKIDSNQYVNRLNRSYPTSVVGFLEHQTSSKRVKHSTNESLSAPFKFIRQQPSISPALIISRKNAKYLSELCLYFGKILTEEQQQRILLQDMRQFYYTDFGNKLQFFRATARMMDYLHSQQKLEKGTLLVDTMGLSLINSFYGPDKLKIQLDQYRSSNPFKFEVDISLKQLKQIFGPFRYALYLTNSHQTQEIMYQRRKIMNGSLLHHTHPGLSSSSLYSDPEVNTTNSSAPEWKSLPKIVWTIWLTGYESAYVICKVAFAIMKHRFQDHGFTVHLVTEQNVRQFLNNQTVTQLERINNNKDYPRFRPTLSDLFRLSLLVKHGGVYIDMSTLMLGDVDWINKIARMPSYWLLNRFSELPKVVNTFNFYMPSPPFWQINPKTHTKQGLIQNYENNFIAAEKDSQYLRRVLQKFKEMLETKTQLVHKYIDSYVPGGKKLFQGEDLYLLQMEMMQTVLLEKQKELNSSKDTKWINAAHYYGLWSLYAPFGPSKYWSRYNHLDDWTGQPNSYYYDYSTEYASGLIGEPRIPFVKLVGRQIKSFEQVFSSYSPGKSIVSQEFHPRSPLRRLMDEFGLQVIRQQGKIEVTEKKK